MVWRRDNSSPSGRICSTEGRRIQERRRILIARFKEVAMRWKCPGSVPAEMFFYLIWLVKLQDRVKRVDSFVRDTIKIRNLLTNLNLFIYIYINI